MTADRDSGWIKKSRIGWLLAAAAVVIAGGAAYLSFAGGSGEPSTELTTPTLAAAPSATSPTDARGEPSTTAVTAGARAFVIDASQSLASFEIDEVLRGSPKRVVGNTSEVAGQVQVDPADLSSARFSQIVINARTFETDSGNRDQAIRGPGILNSARDEFEFITFDVTSIDGLGDTLATGEAVQFSLTGDLLIRDTVNPATFDVTVTLVDDSTTRGIAEATVLRSEYGIGIPSAPGMAQVGDEVAIVLDFVATT